MPAENAKRRPGVRPGAEIDPSAEGGPEDPGSTRGLLGVTVRRPVGVFMVLMAVALFGYTSLERLPLNLLPDLSFPTLTVRTTWEGAAPEEIETRITRPLEESLRMVPGLVESTSTSRADLSSIRLQFAWGTDMRFASQDVAERVQQSRNELPRDVEQPLILRYDPTLEPVLRLAVRTKVSGELPELRRYAEDELSRALEKVEGVAAAKVKGGLEEEIHIDLDEDLLAGQGLTVGDVSRRLGEENIDVAAGSLLDGDTEYLVRTQNQLRTLDEVRELVLARRGNAVIRLHDVGKVVRDARERDVMLRVDGTEGVMVEIHREAGQNLVEAARRVRERMFGTDEQKAYVKQHQERLDRERLKETRAIAQAKPDKKKSEGAGKGSGKRGRRGKRGRGAFRGMSGGGGGGPMDEAGRQRRLDREMTSYLAYTTPETFEAVLLEDSSVFVESAINEVNQAVLLGGLLSILVLFLFLRRFRPTFIIAVSLPASVLLTFAGLFLFDISLNLMSLGGLALGIGMLVDNSIVVLESIVRCREEGDELVRAVLRGTREVGGAVFASTLTTVAVFLPIVFVEGIAGQIFGDQAITVVLSLVASLAAALFLIPMLQSRTFQSGKDTDLGRPWTFPSTRERWSTVRRGPWLLKPLAVAVLPLVFVLELIGLILFTVIVIVIGRGGGLLLRGGGKLLSIVLLPITWPFDKGYDALEALYRPVLRVALRRRALTLLVALGVVVYAVLLYPRLGAELLPRIRQGRFAVEVTLPVTTPVERTDAVLGGVVPALLKIEGVRSIATLAGVDRTDVEAADEGTHTGRIRVYLDDGYEAPEKEESVLTAVRKVIDGRPELNAPRIAFPELVSLKPTLDIELIDDNLERLHASAAKAASILEHVSVLRDVDSGLGRGTPEVVLELNPVILIRHGLTRRQVAESVRAKVQGERPTRFTDKRRLEVRVGLDKKDLRGIEALKRVRVDQGGEGVRPVLLGDIARFNVTEGPSEILRVGGKRVHRISANLMPGTDMATAAARAEAALAEGLGPTTAFDVVGQSEELEKSQQSLLVALITAAFLVYVVMASQFESFVQPLIIVVTLPLALVGVLTALFVLGEPVGVVVLIGVIVLAGIVVNNAIVLIDTTNQLRERGLGATNAVEAAGHLRLRPILMTTATTVLGVLPMILQSGPGTEIRRPLGVAVAAGLTSATLLTLIVIPVIYSVVEGFLEKRRGGPGAGRGGATAALTDERKGLMTDAEPNAGSPA